MTSKMSSFLSKKRQKRRIKDVNRPSGPWRPIVAGRLLSPFCDPNGQKMPPFTMKMVHFSIQRVQNLTKDVWLNLLRQMVILKKNPQRGILPPIFD